MQCKCDADVAYLVAPKARSRAGVHIYMVGNKVSNIQIINAPIMLIATILKIVIGSAEAEVAALYHCAQELVPLRQACIELGHP